MILEKEYECIPDVMHDVLYIDGSDTSEDDELVIRFVSMASSVDIYATPEVLRQYIKLMEEALNDISTGKYEGPPI